MFVISSNFGVSTGAVWGWLLLGDIGLSHFDVHGAVGVGVVDL